MQCMKEGKVGWAYKYKTHYFYASWLNLESKIPHTAYFVSSEGIKEVLINNFDKLKTIISPKGYGITLSKAIPWEDLMYLGIAKKLI